MHDDKKAIFRSGPLDLEGTKEGEARIREEEETEREKRYLCSLRLST